VKPADFDALAAILARVAVRNAEVRTRVVH